MVTSHKLPAVLIYEDYLLPCSQTFVQSQAESLKRFTPYYVGIRPVPDGLTLPQERRILLNHGGWRGTTREAFFRLAGIAPGLIKRLRTLKPVLVHAHFGPDALNALVLSRALGLPLIVTHHGYDVTTKAEFPVSYAHKRYLRRKPVLQRNGQLFLAVSRYIRDRLIGQGFPQDRVRVHYVGVDTSLFSPPAERNREPVVLFVGRLVENKGCIFLLRAMASVRVKCPDARFVVIGEGQLRQELEAQARSMAANCVFLGQQPQTVIRDWMARSSVLCVPSITAENGVSEAFGLVFIEAQAMGLPVVSFANGGVAEAVADGVTGYLTREKDVAGLAIGITRLLLDPILWSKFSDAGITRIRSKFDLTVQSGELEKLYEQVLGNYGKRHSMSSCATTVDTISA